MQKRVFLICCLFFCWTSLSENEQPKDWRFYIRSGMEMMQKKNYAEAADSFEKASELVPGFPYPIYMSAQANTLAGNLKEGATWLEKLVQLGFTGTFEGSEAFQPILASPDYESLAAKVRKLKEPVGNSEIAFTIPEKDLIAEGIAYDPTEERFFVGSTYLRKIITIKKSGKAEDFSPAKAGLWQVLGIKVDAAQGVLWAVTSAFGPEMVDFRPEDEWKSAIIKFDLKSKAVIKKYLLDNKPDQHGLNDLDVSSKGDVYVTDTAAGSIYVIPHSQDELTLFLQPDSFRGPNGIALSSDGKHLFVAHSLGVSVVEIANTKASQLPLPNNVTAAGIDGLYFYNNTLIGVQNSYTPERIIQFELDDSLSRIVSAKILAANHPAFNVPTTGTVADGYFYYIANSQLDSFDQNSKILPIDKLQDLVILRVKIS